MSLHADVYGSFLRLQRAADTRKLGVVYSMKSRTIAHASGAVKVYNANANYRRMKRHNRST